MMLAISLLALVVAAPVMAQRCPIRFEGRIGRDVEVGAFDSGESLFEREGVKGNGLKWSEIIEFPDLPLSLFDTASHKPFSITINDSSIPAPSSTNLRRAELLLPASTIGIKILHFSVRFDPARPLNHSHEYQLVFLESEDHSTTLFALKTGTPLHDAEAGKREWLRLVGNGGGETLFEIPFSDGWHNFGLTLDFAANTIQVLYSSHLQPLVPVTAALANDLHGEGGLHVGLLKKPVGRMLTDMRHQGFQKPVGSTSTDVAHQEHQESGIEEAVIYGGVFEEDSEGGCVSLAPGGEGGHRRWKRGRGGYNRVSLEGTGNGTENGESTTQGRGGYNRVLLERGRGGYNSVPAGNGTES